MKAEPLSRKLEVELYAQDGESFSSIIAGIEGNGDLLISGHDMGKFTLEFWGEDEYEYWLSIRREYKTRVLEALTEYCNHLGLSIPPGQNNINRSILAYLQEIYGGHICAFSEFRDLLKARGIPAKFDSYV